MWQSNSLFDTLKIVELPVNKDHELVKLSDTTNWGEMISIAMEGRTSSRKTLSGPAPKYRSLLGALVLMATKNIGYRDAEDLIANYVPARYLCDLLDSTWTPDHVTIFEFMQMLGPSGVERINTLVLGEAVSNGLCDPSILMSDTTAQEAKIPYPNEAGLMNRFMKLVSHGVSRLRGGFDTVKDLVAKAAEKTKGLLRNAHLFAKGREAKGKIERKMFHTVREVQKALASVIGAGANVTSKAGQELSRLSEVMKMLLPQIKHFLTTGFVAAHKIIHLQIPELYSIVRGKAGKKVEFGIKWMVSRIGGGFVQGSVIDGGAHKSDTVFCKESIKKHIQTFGKAPRTFGFDRGGDSDSNIRAAKKLGVKDVGIAPKGNREWSVSDAKRDKISRERAQVEGSIGTIKSQRYGFNKPNARSKSAMLQRGHRAILGFNMRKMIAMMAMNDAAA